MTGAGWLEPRTDLLCTPGGGCLEYLRTGHGVPVTLFVPGLGGSIAETQPFGSGVPGTRIFLHLRGHGRSTPPATSPSAEPAMSPSPPAAAATGWTYADLAADLSTMAEHVAATHVVGVSLGAGVLCHLVAAHPGRFERLVFLLPAVLDQPRAAATRTRLAALLSRDPARLAEMVSAEIPAPARDTPAARTYLTRRVAGLTRHPPALALAGLADQAPVADRAALAAVRAPALVIGCHGDDLHPASVAERLAESLGGASLHLYDEPGVVWTARADLRRRISTFLSGPAGAAGRCTRARPHSG